MLRIERQIFNFVENDKFKNPLPKERILHSINPCMCEYNKEVVNILNVLLLRFKVQINLNLLQKNDSEQVN